MRYRDPLLVKQLFNSVAPSYDILNDIFSFGLHRLWKKQLLNLLQPSIGEKWLDLCCGTGDLSIYLSSRLGNTGSIIGVDFSPEQINFAKKRAFKKSLQSITWLKADVLNSGLQQNEFDGIVMAYGLRNLSAPEHGLREIKRLLKPGSRAGLLDFNRTIEGSTSFHFQRFYLRKFVVPIASILGLHEQYSYLEESLKNFPNGSEQEKIALNLGFQKASYRVIAGGQMGILLLVNDK
ncbi:MULTISPECIES: bifunctional demethylmenaquinone methyltransferase/2-methoxy-6-polyprenyl-1,4-benzoquinol methylase UbiE [Prochlorococcus]|uniref:bifunctional demethylmenaquinone methyltransferase/2-methoxy-6-polyprenyl-1,4-benzoquinol methylase UbiE n=1 Tax=Prochlorococcus TaxID=1218 RepID=UPI000533AEE7|nr:MULTISPECIES: bifunctional demethylmenaquinone methyltransferase/2-methoxy-6-polyprenyl-1,4-benzoquinol methylase UbiE [Prochlorococcus]KGG12966.1 2-heptaprenyl-1,4-naphthoquinone methyltransferase [Prochlorococcus sp. MIT 0601]